MKFNLALLALLLSFTSSAQTNSGNVFGDLAKDIGLSTNPTNWAAVPFVGFASHGRTAFGLVAVENVAKNIGIMAGVDTLFGAGKIGSANIVSGGLTLQAPFHPLQFIGMTGWTSNLMATPYAVALVGTPVRGTGTADGGLATITRVGVEVDLYNWKGFEFGLGGDYGKRSGSGGYDGNWVDVMFSVRKGF